MTNPLHNPALLPPGAAPANGVQPAKTRTHAPAPNGHNFADVLATQAKVQARAAVQQASSVTFSNHALQRLQRRGIEVDANTMQRLDSGVARAAAKGARDSVVLVDGTAFVVSVRNRTVITAVDRDHMRDHVFTNIDSAVIA